MHVDSAVASGVEMYRLGRMPDFLKGCIQDDQGFRVGEKRFWVPVFWVEVQGCL